MRRLELRAVVIEKQCLWTNLSSRKRQSEVVGKFLWKGKDGSKFLVTLAPVRASQNRPECCCGAASERFGATPMSCGGETYRYRAVKRYRLWSVRVNAHSGRIISARVIGDYDDYY